MGEKTIEVPKIQVEEKIIKVPKITQQVIDTLVQHQVQTVEVEKPRIIQKTVQRKKPILQENITQVPKIMEQIVPVEVIVPETVTKERQVPMLQTVQKTVEVPEVVFVDRVVDVPVTKQRQGLSIRRWS